MTVHLQAPVEFRPCILLGSMLCGLPKGSTVGSAEGLLHRKGMTCQPACSPMLQHNTVEARFCPVAGSPDTQVHQQKRA